jgi:hypothetical protein
VTARSHDLRRTFASLAADMGYSDATIAELLGHAHRGVTERHYGRRSDPVLIALADACRQGVAAAMSGRIGKGHPHQGQLQRAMSDSYQERKQLTFNQ